jgi:hypothetical protein
MQRTESGKAESVAQPGAEAQPNALEVSEFLPMATLARKFADGRLHGAQRLALIQQAGMQYGNAFVARLLTGVVQRQSQRRNRQTAQAPQPSGTIAQTITCASGTITINIRTTNPTIDNSHDVAWIRTEAERLGHGHPMLLAFTPVTFRPGQVTAGAQPGTFVWNPVIDTPTIYMPSNLLPENSPGYQELLRHEREHIPRFVTAMQQTIGRISSTLDYDYSQAIIHNRNLTRNRISLVILAQDNQRDLRQSLSNAATSWDNEDYPRLHRRLRELRISVP